MQGHRVAGGLFLASAVVELIAGEFAFLQAGLGLGLLLVQDQAKSDLLRLLVFCWCLLSVGIALFVALGSGLWLGLLPALLYAGSVAGLMLEGLTRAQALLLLAAAIGSIVLAVFIGEPHAA